MVDEGDLRAVFGDLRAHGGPAPQLVPEALLTAGRRARRRRVTVRATGLAATTLGVAAAVPVLLGMAPATGSDHITHDVNPASSNTPTPPAAVCRFRNTTPMSDPAIQACIREHLPWGSGKTALPNSGRS